MAGIFHGGRGAEATESVNLQVSKDHMQVDWMLESYHYVGNPKMTGIIRRSGDTVFMDSGAFSMFTQGVKIDPKEYGRYLLDNQDIWHVASNLDDVTKTPEISYQNQKILEGMGCKVQPVFHTREDPIWLQRYIDEGYDYIFLGGMVPESTPWLMQWLDDLWEHYLTHPDGTPRVKVHGFGLTTLDLMFRYPWFSVDSTSWVMTSRMGSIYLDLPHRDIKLQISDRSPSRQELNQHYDSLPPVMQAAVRARIEELGFDADLLRSMYGWRDVFNVAYFNRIQHRRVDRFVPDKKGLFPL